MITLSQLRTFALSLLLAVTPAWASDFPEPRPGLHTGGQPTEAELAEFAKQGVKTVIDLRGEGEDRGYDETAATQRLGLRYETLPINGAEDLTPANAARLKQLLASGGNNVLLHCASGNRVGALLALMAQQEEGASREQALELGKQAGMKSLTPVVEKQLQP